MDLQETFGHLGEEVKKIPWWGWLAVGGVVIFLFWGKLPFGQSDQGSSTTAPVTSGDTSGGDTSGGGSSDGGTPPPTSGGPAIPPPITVPKPPTTAPKPPAPSPPKRTYTIKPGDTLSGIASANGENWEDIYNRNANIIEQVARQHGFSDSDHGHWIFPGTTITL